MEIIIELIRKPILGILVLILLILLMAMVEAEVGTLLPPGI